MPTPSFSQTIHLRLKPTGCESSASFKLVTSKWLALTSPSPSPAFSAKIRSHGPTQDLTIAFSLKKNQNGTREVTHLEETWIKKWYLFKLRWNQFFNPKNSSELQFSMTKKKHLRNFDPPSCLCHRSTVYRLYLHPGLSTPWMARPQRFSPEASCSWRCFKEGCGKWDTLSATRKKKKRLRNWEELMLKYHKVSETCLRSWWKWLKLW